MLFLSKLLPYKFYRAGVPVHAPYDTSNTLKNSMVAVVAPSIKTELEFISEEYFVFKNLAKIYQEKHSHYQYFNHAKTKVTNDDVELSLEYISENFKGNSNLENINAVIRPLENAKTDNLKRFNLLYESNHILYNILNNEKDKRLAHLLGNDVFSYFDTYFQRKITPSLNYPIKTIFIPVNKWLDIDDYTEPRTFNKTNRNLISLIYQKMLTSPETFNKTFKGYKVVFTHMNEFIIFDPSVETKDSLADIFKQFLKKCRSTPASISTETSDIDTAEELAVAEELSNKEIKAATIISNSKLNMDNLSSDKKEKITNMVIDQIDKGLDDDTEITKDLKTIKSDDQADVLLNARLAGLTVANYQRNEMLKNKYQTIKYKDRFAEEILHEEVDISIPKTETSVNTINDSLKQITANDFAKAYNDKLSDRDTLKILMHFATCKPALYLISDPKIEDVSDTINRLYRFTVEFEDEKRKRHKFSFLMPKFYKDKYLFFNESKWDITHQKFPFPSTKIKSNEVQVCGNYNKIFMTRNGQNISPRLTQLKKILLNPKTSSQVKVFPGNVTQYNKAVMETIEYGELGKEISRINIGDTYIYLNSKDAAIIIKNYKPGCIPVAINNKRKITYHLDPTSNIVYDEKDNSYGELSEFIISLIGEFDAKLKDEFDKLPISSKYSYSEVTIMGKHIPLILVLAASNPDLHLKGILDQSKISYEISEKRVNVDKSVKGVIQFSDCYLIYDRYPYENALLLNGLSVANTREYTFNEMMSRDTYIDIFDTLYGSRTLIDGLENFYYLFIDPITEEICEKLEIPSTYNNLLMYSSGLLADSTYDIESSYRNCRIRSNEIVNVYLYQALCDAYKNYKIGRSPKFSIAENAVLKLLIASNIVDPHTQLNIVKNVENDLAIKMSGPVGLNLDEAYTLEKRAFSDSMKGIVGMNTTPSGEVGVTRHLTLNRNIIDARGFIEIEKKEYDGTELLTPGELMNTFVTESADAERAAMAISQTKHQLQTKDPSVSLINYDMPRVLPKLASDFAFTAQEDGEVLDMNDDTMIIKYKSGKIEDIDLSVTVDKNSDGGFYLTNQMVTKLRKGSKFKKSDVLSYNPKQIIDKDIYGDVCATEGVLARVAIISSGEVYEDSTKVSAKFADRLSSGISTVKNITLTKYSNIRFIAKKGDVLEANDPILLFDDTQDEFTSSMLAAMAEEAGDSDDILATGAPILSKTGGTITDIRIYYTVPLNELSPSLQKIVKAYTTEVSKKEKFIAKYMDVKDANTILAPTNEVKPDASGKVKGIQIGEGVIIQFAIEYLDVYGVGDKLTNYGAVKGIDCDVIPLGLEGWTESNPDRPIDSYIAQIGLYRRMTLDVIKVGFLSKILIEKKRIMKSKYHDKIKNELK